MTGHLIQASIYLDSSHVEISKMVQKRKRAKNPIPVLNDFAIETSYLRKLSEHLNKFSNH